MHKTVIHFHGVGDLRSTRCDTSSTADTGDFPDFFRYVFSLAIVAMSVTVRAGPAKIMTARDGGKLTEMTAVPNPATFTFLQGPVDIILDIEAVARWTH